MSSLKDKVIVVSGGASGIALETVRLLISKGAKVGVADKSEKNLAAVLKEFQDKGLGDNIITVCTDVSKLSDVENWINQTVQKFGRLDGAVNSAAAPGRFVGVRTIAEIDDDDWNESVAVNLTGMMYALRAQLRKIVDGGSIVNVSSVAGMRSFAKSAPYVATKHAVIGLTRNAAKEFAHRNIRVNSIAPGRVDTPMLAHAQNVSRSIEKAPQEQKSTQEAQGQVASQAALARLADYSGVAMNRLAQPREIAEVICFVLSPEASFVTGQVYVVDGGSLC